MEENEEEEEEEGEEEEGEGISMKRQSQAPTGGPPWDVVSEKICTAVNAKRQIFFDTVLYLNCAMNYTLHYMMFVHLKIDFST